MLRCLPLAALAFSLTSAAWTFGGCGDDAPSSRVDALEDTSSPADVSDTVEPDGVGPDTSTGDADAPDAGPGDGAIVPAPIHEPFPGPPVPNTMVEDAGFPTTCAVAGHEIPRNGADVIDDCVICQCTTYGGRCARRGGCERDVCVFVDGTTVARGDTVRIDGCFLCTCDAGGGSCVRDTEAPCPADACMAPRGPDLAFGAEIFFSECHACTCDEVDGTRCTNLCHPHCLLRVGDDVWIADQERAPADDGCGSCVCDYGDVFCDPRGCDPQCTGVQGCLP